MQSYYPTDRRHYHCKIKFKRKQSRLQSKYSSTRTLRKSACFQRETETREINERTWYPLHIKTRSAKTIDTSPFSKMILLIQ
mmetsp:Transcript_24951/g.33058  ORF Transcript_24951/g.33058 Transcript_24951/m.33058 type:complete len:82 (+) Transcript_24951:146-391(+)